jgi:hypothetical protein
MNSSALVPLMSMDMAWLVDKTADRMRHKQDGSHLPPDWFNKASMLAQLTSISYCTHSMIELWNCSRCTAIPGKFQLQTMVYDLTWDLFAYAGYSEALDAMVVAFRGTDSHSWYNWIENMRYWRTEFQIPYPEAAGALVHTGFFMSYNASSLAPNITIAVRELVKQHPGKPLYVAGHSMGAAMAHICAIDLRFTINLTDVRVYTYGSPRVGNTIFEEFFKKIVTESVRVTHNRDIVPSVPLQIMGFHHVPTEIWQVDFDGQHVLGICDESGEDPLCHNSVCYLGLCTSVADHMQYLGAHMYHRIPGC